MVEASQSVDLPYSIAQRVLALWPCGDNALNPVRPSGPAALWATTLSCCLCYSQFVEPVHVDQNHHFGGKMSTTEGWHL